MNSAAILCSNCYTALPATHCNTNRLVPCPTCQADVEAVVFPAAFRIIPLGQTAERILVDGESSCFYHEQKKAVVPCDLCGRFLCALCDVELDGKHLCPPCLDAGRQKGTLQQLETRRVLYDGSALLMAVAPLIVLYFLTFITAPIAIFLAIYSFFKPNSILGHSPAKAWAAIIIATLQLAGWGLLFFGLMSAL
jgi:hypothetical protein